jgi:hypothetical protein
MQISTEKHVRDSQPLEVVRVEFESNGFKINRPVAVRLLELLTAYFDGSLEMGGSRTEDKLMRLHSEPGVLLLDERPANLQGVCTNGTLTISINDSTAYLTLNDNDSKAFIAALEDALSVK